MEKTMEPVIRRVDEENDAIGDFIHEGFTAYGKQRGVTLNYDEFCFTAEDGDGKIIGVITGRAYYNEVHIGDLIIDKEYRGQDIGTKLVKTVEEAYGDKGYEKFALTTFGFQAPEFYKKLGYTLEYVREDKNPKLSKFFYLKEI